MNRVMLLWVRASLLVCSGIVFLPLSSSLGPTYADIGTCSTDEVGDLKNQGFSTKEIKELCGGESKRQGSRDFDQEDRPSPRGRQNRQPPQASMCGCFAGPSCQMAVAVPEGSPCYCATPFGTCQGRAF
jgi:hypothetical protein